MRLTVTEEQYCTKTVPNSHEGAELVKESYMAGFLYTCNDAAADKESINTDNLERKKRKFSS